MDVSAFHLVTPSKSAFAIHSSSLFPQQFKYTGVKPKALLNHPPLVVADRVEYLHRDYNHS
jgi:hypothetical protein